MNLLGLPVLSFLVFFPLVGVLALAFVPRTNARLIRILALATALVECGASFALFSWFRPGFAGMQFEENVPWLTGLGASWHLGVDGLSLFLVLLTTVLTALSILGSFDAIQHRVKAYYMLFLGLLTAMVGTFVALDLLVFYFFWEFMLIPMYLLVGVWGGSERIKAAIRFFLYTFLGSILMLVAIIALYFIHHAQTGVYTLDLLELYKTNVPLGAQVWLFLAFGLAFAIKVPMWPFHTWLPLAHVEAPTAGSVILAAVLLKMGTYGFMRFAMPLFPNATLALTPIVLLLAIVGIIYGALVAMVQPDLKKLVAYSSVSHLGFCMLGMFAFTVEGWSGSILQMINHGISTGALFLLVGVIYERRHTRLISEFGGLWKVIPVFTAVFLVVMLSSIGLPGTNGFVGEFLVLVGAFGPQPFWTVLATTGVVLSACYMLWMFQRVVWGPVSNSANENLRDLTPRETLVLAPLVVLIFWIGIFPTPILQRMQPSVASAITMFQEKAMLNREFEAREALQRAGVEPCCPGSETPSGAAATTGSSRSNATVDVGDIPPGAGAPR
ncbi:MAG: complex I subunit 4 family protein [Candidatus Eiseniibacteriota bacterium]